MRLLSSLAAIALLACATRAAADTGWTYADHELSRADSGAGDAKLVFDCGSNGAYLKLPKALAPAEGEGAKRTVSWEVVGEVKQRLDGPEEKTLEYHDFDDGYASWWISDDAGWLYDRTWPALGREIAYLIITNVDPARPKLVFGLYGMMDFMAQVHDECKPIGTK